MNGEVLGVGLLMLFLWAMGLPGLIALGVFVALTLFSNPS